MVAGEFMKGELTLDELIDRLYLVAQTGTLNAKENEKREGVNDGR